MKTKTTVKSAKRVIQAELEQIKGDAHICVTTKGEQTKFGYMELAVVSCSPVDFDKVITVAVKHGCAHEKFITATDMGVKVYFW